MATVEESWTRIVTWLGDAAPATATGLRSTTRGHATADRALDRAAVERALDRPLTPDLAEWWSLAGDASGAERLIPLEHTPLSVAAALEVRRERLDQHLRRGESIVDGEAGEPSRGFQSAFVPIAGDGHGRYLFVDLRGGPLHGCVGEWDDVGSFVDVISWPSVAEMLGDVADALVHGVPALTFHAAGRLRHNACHPEVPVLTCRAAVTPTGHLTWAT
ncbi:SMI1/KNR4 family protein [Virgisporangium ochraceum]|uniref:SMI1/KNR4 family protein n=1 Tax=Virgisporangium ochraceum TaxID=65505 RepID=UPI001942FB94|nr:SMI1/KNR4 family protein [Virgisporangium ochraceum]